MHLSGLDVAWLEHGAALASPRIPEPPMRGAWARANLWTVSALLARPVLDSGVDIREASQQRQLQGFLRTAGRLKRKIQILEEQGKDDTDYE